MLEKKQETSLFSSCYLKTLSTGPDGNWTCDLPICKLEITELSLQDRGIPIAEYGHLYEPLRYCGNYKVLWFFVYWIDVAWALQEVLCYWHQLTWEEKLDNYTKTGPQIISLSRQQVCQEFNEFFNCIITTWCPSGVLSGWLKIVNKYL